MAPSGITTLSRPPGDAAQAEKRAQRKAAKAEKRAQDARQKQAKAAGHSTADELDLLTVHGILHLLGYDHAEPEEHKEMFGLQAQLLAEWQGHRAENSGPETGPETGPATPGEA